MIKGKCIKTCTIPVRGLVIEDEVIEFDLPEWDVKKFSYLKHFEEIVPLVPAETPKKKKGKKKEAPVDVFATESDDA